MQSVHYRILRSHKDTLHGPSDRIRTCGILLPKQARYQLRYTRMFDYGDYSTKAVRWNVFSVCGQRCDGNSLSSLTSIVYFEKDCKYSRPVIR